MGSFHRFGFGLISARVITVGYCAKFGQKIGGDDLVVGEVFFVSFPPHFADVLVDFAESPAKSRVKFIFDGVFSTSRDAGGDSGPFVA